MQHRVDVILRAHEVGKGLTDMERIAVGATLIMTVLAPGEAMHVRTAARKLREHADALDAFGRDLDDISHTGGSVSGETTTHGAEQSGPSVTSGPLAPESPGRGSSPAPWAAIRRFWLRIESGPLGDWIGGLSLAFVFFAIFAIGALITD